MTDVLSEEQRRRNMAAIRNKNTKPELRVRRALHAAGLRYRLHVRSLPGSPDLVFPSRRVVVFVHGCFWHRHPHCRNAQMPKSRREFWGAKLAANVERDRRQRRALQRLGWRVLIFWECQSKDASKLNRLIDQVRAGQEGD
jgi:DNA mismatch endonuclease (patch repair protein)